MNNLADIYTATRQDVDFDTATEIIEFLTEGL